MTMTRKSYIQAANILKGFVACGIDEIGLVNVN
jgi:hypothetical protein